MTNGATNPMLTHQQATSATSFLSVLSTVGRPSQATNANNPGSDQQSDADAATAQQQSRDAAQDTVPAQKPGVPLAAPFTDVAGTNLTILPVGRFHAVLSTANASSPVAGKSAKDQQATDSSTSQPSNAVTDNTQPVPVPVVATDIPAATTQSLAQSIAAIPAVATGTADAAAFNMPAAGNLVAQSTDPQPSVDTTPAKIADATEQQAPSVSIPIASTQPIAADSATTTEPRANKTENAPQTDASPAPALPTQAIAQNTNAQQSKDTSNSDAAGNASQGGTATPVRNSNDRSFFLPAAPGVFGVQAQNANQASSDDSKTSESTDNAKASGTDAAAATQSTNAAQNAAAQAALVSGVVLPAPQPLPNVNFAATTGFSLQASNKGSDSKVTDAGSTSTANGTSSTKNSSAQDSNSTPAAQTGGSANTQHAQADPSQNVAIAPKAMDAVVVPTSPVHVASQPLGTTGSDGKQHSADVPSATLPAAGEGLETAGSSGVNAAKLIQTLSETQMHVGMRSAEFGDISIRTAISQQQMVAQITVDHGDLGRAIAQHLPAAQSKLGDDLGLRAAIEVTQSGTGFSNEGGNAQQDQRSFARPLEVAGVLSTAETQSLTPRTAVEAENADRLDIRA
jgi:hypothetical protein